MGGKGGVGKTTCAAALAVRVGRSRRTLLVTTDPASSLGDALRVHVRSVPTPVRRGANLDACALDAPRAFNAWVADRRAILTSLALRGTYLDREDVARLLDLSLPGLDEVVALLEVRRLAEGYEHVVVDTAPTGHTLRLLAMPALYGRIAAALDQLQAHHRMVVSALRGRYREDEGDALIRAIDAEASALGALLRDRTTTHLAWVTLPEPMALEETADALRWLANEGLAAGTLIVNRVTRASATRCQWHEARRLFEARALASIPRAFPGVVVRTVPDLEVEPAGIRDLTRIAAACVTFVPPAAQPPVPSRVYGAVSGDAFELHSILSARTRWLLLGGKGGVGKSTCAAAIALAAATRAPARRFLLLSTDPAHSLADVFGTRVGDTAAPLPGYPANLDVREMDAAAVLERFRQRYVDSIDRAVERFARGALAGAGEPLAFRNLIDVAPPGIDEVMAVAEVGDILEARGGYATVICDTAPTGHALRLLQAPDLLRGWTQALMTILLKYQAIAGAGDFASLLVQLSKRLRALDARLRDPSAAGFVLVTRAAALPREETVRLRDALGAMGIGIRAIIANAVGAAGTCGRCAAAGQVERREIGRLRARLGDRGAYAIIEAPAVLPPPHGPRLVDWIGRWRMTR